MVRFSLSFFLVMLAACGGNDTGTCISTNGNGVDDEANAGFSAVAAGVELCEDGSQRTGCDRLNGEFTKDAAAADACPAAGFTYYCESQGIYLVDEADCPA